MDTAGDGCIANIGPRERRRRLRLGIAALSASVVIAVVLAATGVHRAWRMVLFFPLWVAALGFFQARDKT